MIYNQMTGHIWKHIPAHFEEWAVSKVRSPRGEWQSSNFFSDVGEGQACLALKSTCSYDIRRVGHGMEALKDNFQEKVNA